MSELRVRVTGLNIDVGEALRSKIHEEVNIGIGKYSSARDGEAVVTLGKERHLFKCEIHLHLDSRITGEAHAEASDPHVAFSAALEKLEKQIRRNKRKMTDHHHA